MIIECKTCHARFRLDESKIKGRGARVKCRKCGEQIVVLKDTEPGSTVQGQGVEGSLDLGSALRDTSGETASASRETPPDNLIHFPKPSARSFEQPPETAGKDEVDLAFEQLLERSGMPEKEVPEEPPPPPPAEPPATPTFEPPAEISFETPAETPASPTFEPPAGIAFEPPAEINFETAAETPATPTFEPPAGIAFEPPAEISFEPPAEISFEPPVAPSASLEPSEAPPREEAEWTVGEGSLPLSPEAKYDRATLEEEEPPPESGKEADISSAIASSPIEEMEPDIPLETSAYPAPEEAVPAPASEGIVVEGNVTPPPGTHEIEIPPYQEEEPGEPALASAPPPEPPENEAPARSGSSYGRVAALALLLSLLAAVGYFGFTDPGKRLVGSVSPRLAGLLGGEGAGKAASRYEVKNVIGYYDSGDASPKILVIKGQVTNLASVGKSGIRVFASLLDNTGNVMMEQAVYAGNVLPGEKLKTESRATLEKALVNPLGENLMNMDVPPGKTIPFMVLFFDAPENIDSYKLEAKDTQ